MLRNLSILLTAILVSACGGGSSGPSNSNPVTPPPVTPPTPTYTLGGSVTGLSASGLVLSDGIETVAVPPNASGFTFPTQLTSSTKYSVTIVSQPTGITQTCVLSNATGSVGNSNITNVAVSCAQSANTISVYAGSIISASVAGTADLGEVTAVAIDASGNLYFTDFYNFTIMKMTPTGVVSVLAGKYGFSGSADGTGSAATFQYPEGLAVAANGNVFVTDTGNNTIRKIDTTGTVTTIAGKAGVRGTTDGTGHAASFNEPTDIAIDTAGNLYVTDTGNNTIRKIDTAGAVTTVAGAAGVSGAIDGTGTAARFNGPFAIAVDGTGNLYVADSGNNTIRHIDTNGAVTTIAGQPGVAGASDGVGASATFNRPGGIAFDSAGNLLVTDSVDYAIRTVTTSGVVTTVLPTSAAGGISTGFGTGAGGIATDKAGNIYIAGVKSILQLAPSGTLSTYVGAVSSAGARNGPAATASFSSPRGIVFDSKGNAFVADYYNSTIRKITPSGQVSVFAGTGAPGVFMDPYTLAIDGADNIYVTEDVWNWILKITPAGVMTTLAGEDDVVGERDGAGSAALFESPGPMVSDPVGNVYVVDGGAQTLRKISPTGTVTTLAGNYSQPFHAVDGVGAAAKFGGVGGIAIDKNGTLYVTDGKLIRQVTSAGVVTSLQSTSGPAFNALGSIAIDANGNFFVIDNGNHTICKMTPTGIVTTIAGTPSATNIVVGALPGALGAPAYIAFDRSGALYVTANDAVLKIALP